MASSSPGERQSRDHRADPVAPLPSRSAWRRAARRRAAPAEARAECRDRETYFADLRFAAHAQNRSTPRQLTAGPARKSGTGPGPAAGLGTARAALLAGLGDEQAQVPAYRGERLGADVAEPEAG